LHAKNANDSSALAVSALHTANLNQGLQSGVSTVMSEELSHAGSVAGGIGASEAGSVLGPLLSRSNSTQTYVWAVPGAKSSNTGVPSQGAKFGVSFAGVSGVNPEEYEPALVKLTSTTNNWRLVGATQGKQDARTSSALDWQMYSGKDSG
jgi:hypothetical protein